jgi:hypothetical protein
VDSQRFPSSATTTTYPATIDLDALEGHIQARLHGRVRDFHLVNGEGGLRLRGSAHSYYAKQLAQHEVMQATNLRILANEIIVS